MLSRADTVLRLIEICKTLKKQESSLDKLPDEYHKRLKKDINKLLIDVIGVPEEGQYKINDILDKAIREEIKSKTAVVAVHEIYKDYEQENSEKGEQVESKKKVVNGSHLEELYKSGYR